MFISWSSYTPTSTQVSFPSYTKIWSDLLAWMFWLLWVDRRVFCTVLSPTTVWFFLTRFAYMSEPKTFAHFSVYGWCHPVMFSFIFYFWVRTSNLFYAENTFVVFRKLWFNLVYSGSRLLICGDEGFCFSLELSSAHTPSTQTSRDWSSTIRVKLSG